MMNVLILGSQGMLGTALQKVFPGAVAWGKKDCDVTNFADLASKIKNLKPVPEAIINCVAFNDVDGAEENSESSYRLNAEVPGNIASLANTLHVPFVHFSTNYVFNGIEGTYLENAIPEPVSVYARSKYAGEVLVAKNTEQYYLIRTAVLFGPAGTSEHSKKSFIQLMLDLSQKNATIKAVSDEVNSITYVPDLANMVKTLLNDHAAYGIYHITNSGQTSWFDFAKEIFSVTQKKIDLIPVSSKEFPRKAVRPKKAVLLNVLLPPLRSWQEALAEFLKI